MVCEIHRLGRKSILIPKLSFFFIKLSKCEQNVKPIFLNEYKKPWVKSLIRKIFLIKQQVFLLEARYFNLLFFKLNNSV